MGITVSWDDEEKTAIRHDYDLQWDWDDFNTAISQTVAMIEGVQRRVDIICNVLNTKIPTSSDYILHGRRALILLNRWLGNIAVVSTSTLVFAMINVFVRVYPEWRGRFIVVSTLELARAALAQRREDAG